MTAREILCSTCDGSGVTDDGAISVPCVTCDGKGKRRLTIGGMSDDALEHLTEIALTASDWNKIEIVCSIVKGTTLHSKVSHKEFADRLRILSEHHEREAARND